MKQKEFWKQCDALESGQKVKVVTGDSHHETVGYYHSRNAEYMRLGDSREDYEMMKKNGPMFGVSSRPYYRHIKSIELVPE